MERFAQDDFEELARSFVDAIKTSTGDMRLEKVAWFDSNFPSSSKFSSAKEVVSRNTSIRLF